MNWPGTGDAPATRRNSVVRRGRDHGPFASAALCALVLLSWAATALAWTGTDSASAPPALRAMGGAGIAGALGTGAIFTNPAAMAAQPGQNIELGFSHDRRPARTGFWAGSVDGNRGGIAGGTVYSYETGKRADGRSRVGTDWRSGIALGGTSDSASIVLGGTLRRVSMDVGAGADEAKESYAGWTGDAGLLIGIGQNLRLGAVWRDIVDVGTSVAAKQEVRSRVGGGISVNIGPVLFAGDAIWPLDGSDASWHAGAAITIASVVQVRGGWRMDPASAARHLIAAGLALRIDSYGIDLGFDIDPQTPDRFRVAASLVFGIPYVIGN